MKNPNAIITSDYGPIISNINDSVITKNIIKTGYWATSDIELIKELISTQLKTREKVAFLDIGANIGTHSLAIGKTFGEQVLIHAFEAQRQIFHMLCGTMAINGLSNIVCHNNAVSDQENQEITIPLPDYNEFNNFGAVELIPPKKSDQQDTIIKSNEIVKTITIDTLEIKADFMKIDVEGMEDKVLKGSEKTILNNRPIIFMEIHKTDHEYVINFFAKKNYLGFLRGIDLILIPHEYQIQINASQRII